MSKMPRQQYSLRRLLLTTAAIALLLGLWRALGSTAFGVVLVAGFLTLPWFYRPRWLYVWLLPMLWVSVARVNFEHPGDEYAGFLVGSIVGFWAPLLLSISGSPRNFLLPVLIAGSMTVTVAGFFLDKVRAPWLPWVILYAVISTAIVTSSLASYPSMERALAKNGSYAAYILPAMNLALYAATLLTGAGTGAYRLYRRRLVAHSPRVVHSLRE